jgi:hypothetical protein
MAKSLMLRIVQALTAAPLLAGCGQESTPAPPPTDTWYRAIDNPAHEFYPLPPFLFSPVKPELIDEAAAAMGDGPLLQLSTSEAIRYADDRLRTVRELRPFLIHGLYRSKRTFTVAIADRALWVDSADSPEDRSAVRRQPLVIYIDEVPPDIYVTVGGARKVAVVGSPKSTP